jgi:chromosome segregation ATPase
MKTDEANVDNENKELDDAEEELKEAKKELDDAEKELKEAKNESKEAEKELHEAEAEFLKELAASTDEDKIASARRLYDMKIKAWELCVNKVSADRKHVINLQNRVNQLWGSFFLLLLFLQ